MWSKFPPHANGNSVGTDVCNTIISQNKVLRSTRTQLPLKSTTTCTQSWRCQKSYFCSRTSVVALTVCTCVHGYLCVSAEKIKKNLKVEDHSCISGTSRWMPTFLNNLFSSKSSSTTLDPVMILFYVSFFFTCDLTDVTSGDQVLTQHSRERCAIRSAVSAEPNNRCFSSPRKLGFVAHHSHAECNSEMVQGTSEFPYHRYTLRTLTASPTYDDATIQSLIDHTESLRDWIDELTTKLNTALSTLDPPHHSTARRFDCGVA